MQSQAVAAIHKLIFYENLYFDIHPPPSASDLQLEASAYFSLGVDRLLCETSLPLTTLSSPSTHPWSPRAAFEVFCVPISKANRNQQGNRDFHQSSFREKEFSIP
jgi:hypothetical protein